MRTLPALAAAAWFAFQAWTIGDGGTGTVCDGQNCYAAGDPGAMAIHEMARILFIGLAILSLALVDWAWAARRLEGTEKPGPDSPTGDSEVPRFGSGWTRRGRG